jgi:hypothetical protein
LLKNTKQQIPRRLTSPQRAQRRRLSGALVSQLVMTRIKDLDVALKRRTTRTTDPTEFFSKL